jgi:hypothetical protein
MSPSRRFLLLHGITTALGLLSFATLFFVTFGFAQLRAVDGWREMLNSGAISDVKLHEVTGGATDDWAQPLEWLLQGFAAAWWAFAAGAVTMLVGFVEVVFFCRNQERRNGAAASFNRS